jgi:hypothetical protein
MAQAGNSKYTFSNRWFEVCKLTPSFEGQKATQEEAEKKRRQRNAALLKQLKNG